MLKSTKLIPQHPTIQKSLIKYSIYKTKQNALPQVIKIHFNTCFYLFLFCFSSSLACLLAWLFGTCWRNIFSTIGLQEWLKWERSSQANVHIQATEIKHKKPVKPHSYEVGNWVVCSVAAEKRRERNNNNCRGLYMTSLLLKGHSEWNVNVCVLKVAAVIATCTCSCV